MFTGIIQEVGRLRERVSQGVNARVRVEAPSVCADARAGDSIAVNGVCLTVETIQNNSFFAGLSSETLRRTTLGRLPLNTCLNIEPALRPTDRMGGHIVAGHVDGVGEIAELRPEGDFWNLVFRFPPELGRYIAEKGSIALDGISLTLTFVERDRAGIALAPFSVEHTNLREKRPGDAINLEVDLVARYLERLLHANESPSGGLTLEKLNHYGYAKT